MDDRTQATHVVNPLMVHVVLQGSETEDGGMVGGRQRRASLQHTSSQQQVSLHAVLKNHFLQLQPCRLRRVYDSSITYACWREYFRNI